MAVVAVVALVALVTVVGRGFGGSPYFHVFFSHAAVE